MCLAMARTSPPSFFVNSDTAQASFSETDFLFKIRRIISVLFVTVKGGPSMEIAIVSESAKYLL